MVLPDAPRRQTRAAAWPAPARGSTALQTACGTILRYVSRDRAETLARSLRQRLSHLDRRDRVLGGDAAQVARVLGIIVGAAAVQGAAVVPDHEVADAPVMAMDELALRGVLHQVAQQQPSIRHRPAEDVGGVRAHVERLALGARMRAHELVARRSAARRARRRCSRCGRAGRANGRSSARRSGYRSWPSSQPAARRRRPEDPRTRSRRRSAAPRARTASRAHPAPRGTRHRSARAGWRARRAGGGRRARAACCWRRDWRCRRAPRASGAARRGDCAAARRRRTAGPAPAGVSSSSFWSWNTRTA